MKFLRLPTENLSQIILAVWIIFSVVFVGNSIRQTYVFSQVDMEQAVTTARQQAQVDMEQAVTAAYQQAQVDIVGQLIQQAETCEAFPIFAGETQIELKKVGCE